MARWLLVVLLSGCAANVGAPNGLISVRGRVVDFERCASEAGCTPLEGMIVALASDPERVVSAPTRLDGTYILSGVPAGYRHDLIVRPRSGASHAPTINPMAVQATAQGDQFNVELYAVPRDPASLLEGLKGEGIDLVLGGGYLGQVVRTNGSMVMAAADVQIVVSPPQQPLRFVSVLPRFVPGEPILRPADADRTGPFGMFVVPARGPVDPFLVVPVDPAITYAPVAAPLAPGFVTCAIHCSVF